MGVTPSEPIIGYNSGGTVQYDAANDDFSLVATPLSIVSDSGAGLFDSGALNISIKVDSSGALIGGVAGDDLVLTGDVDIDGDFVIDYFASDGPLLTAEISQFGFQDSGGPLDVYDFRFTLTGGQLADDGFFTGDIGVITTSDNSTFEGDFNVDFGGGAKGELGAIDEDATKSGRKYHDRNADGVRDADGADDTAGNTDDEAGLAGWTIAAFADNNDDGMLDAGDTFATSDVTDDDGLYSVTLTPGQQYIIVERISDQPGWFESPDDDTVLVNTFDTNYGRFGYVVTLASGEVEEGNDFGNYQKATKNGMKFHDHNANGIKDPGDEGLEGWVIHLDGTDGSGNAVNLTTATDGSGNYSFTVSPGAYTVSEESQPGWIQSAPAGGVHVITLTSGQTDSGNDFGNYRNATKTGRKYDDLNGDGDDEGGSDPSLSGWTIAAFADNDNSNTLSAADSLSGTDLTDGNGVYSFSLKPGKYIIVEQISNQPNWLESPDDDTVAVNNAFNPIYGVYGYVVVLTSGLVDSGNDFGNVQKRPDIDIEKTTNGPTNSNPTAPDYDNEDAENGPGVPLLIPGSTVTWTYKVTNTGNVPFTAAEVVVVDDNGTPGNSSDDFSPTLIASSDAGADGILSPGEIWLYQASGIVQDVGTSGGTTATFDFSGSSALDGPDGNIRTFSAGGISVKASAWSRTSAGTWDSAFLGAYSGGLGVTDTGEGDGSNNSHTVDNFDRLNFVLFEFDEEVVIDSAFLGYVVNDSDLHIWIGTVSDPFNNHQTLSDAFLISLGFNEANDTTLTTPRTADVNAGNVSGNVIIIASSYTDTTPDDKFKIEKMTVETHGCYENKAVVTVPGDSDSDLSHYCNPPAEPGIDIEKSTNGPTNSNSTAPNYDNEDAANGSGVPILTPGSTVTWTYKVTNTGNVPFTFSQVVVRDDNGTPGNTADDFTPTFVVSSDAGADGVLSPGEVWMYTASATVQNLSAPAPGAPTVFDMSGSSAVNGTAGNVRTFTSGTISVKASGFSREKTSNSWATAYLGSYGGGLGVTDGIEDGSADTHTVDNVGRDNYVLFRFSENVIVDSAFLGYVVNDSDLKVWIGTISNAFTSSVALSDAVLASLGFSEVNYASDGSTRTADFNAGNLSGNVLVIAADPGDADPEDRFKIELLTVRKPQPGIYENKATVAVPGDEDSDLSHYKNPIVPPPPPPPPPTGSISGKKYKDETGNGLTSDDTPLTGTVIYIDADNDGVKDAGEMSTTTGTNGSYQFNGLASGTYVVREVVPYGYVRTAPTLSDHYVVSISGSTAATGKNFANFEKCEEGHITNVWYTIKRGTSTFNVTTLVGNTNQGDIVTVNFTVIAAAGIEQLSLVSYTAPDPYFDDDRAYLQKLYEAQTGYFMPGTHSMTVRVPSSYFQIDFVCGPVIDKLGPAGSNIFYSPQGRLISADNDGMTAPSATPPYLGTTLVVGGSIGDDDLQFKVSSDSSKIAVMINGGEAGRVSFGSGSGVPITALAGYGYAGHDSIRVTGLSLNATLRGGDGNDILVGGSGADYIWGDYGRDLMIGGTGRDTIRGSAQDDILIGGTTAYDNNLVALDKIMQEWARADTFANRVYRLKSGVSDGLNGTYNLIADGTSRTVFDDSVQDILYGDEGYDWLLANTDADGGSVNDLVYSAESVTDID